MAKYLVLTSFAGVDLTCTEGELVELNAEQAKSLAPFIVPAPKASALETADVQPEVETADVKAPRSKRKG